MSEEDPQKKEAKKEILTGMLELIHRGSPGATEGAVSPVVMDLITSIYPHCLMGARVTIRQCRLLVRSGNSLCWNNCRMLKPSESIRNSHMVKSDKDKPLTRTIQYPKRKRGRKRIKEIDYMSPDYKFRSPRIILEFDDDDDSKLFLRLAQLADENKSSVESEILCIVDAFFRTIDGESE